VVGTIATNEYDDKDGIRRSSLEVRATAVGPDLARYLAKLERHGQPGAAAGAEPEVADSAVGPAAGTDESLAMSA